MKRLLSVVLSVCFVSLAAAASAQTLRVTADRTNVRDKASTDGAIVVAVSKGDELEVLEKAGNWYRVRVKAGGAQGYVNALVVEVVPGSAAAPAAAAPAARPATPAAAPAAQAPGQAPPRASDQAPTGPQLGGDKKFFIRPFGGLWTGYSSLGFGGGAGVALRPFPLPELELEIDVAYARQNFNSFSVFGLGDFGYHANLIQGSGNVLYDFKHLLPNSKWAPFAGAGVMYSHETFTYDRDILGCGNLCTFSAGWNGIGTQGIIGVELPFSDKRAWRFQARVGNGILLLAGISF
jgi:hypothetical protein